MERGWNEERQAFVQHFDSDVLDASLLLMPLVKFVGPTDPRWLSTLDRIRRELVADSWSTATTSRPRPIGPRARRGPCDVLVLVRRGARARASSMRPARVREDADVRESPRPLYLEEIGPTGEQLGNFPQAFTHLALISAAFNLDRALDS